MATGFKEWTLICDAIERAEQSIILRKGGIHEGREGFRFEHAEFFLFPTLFHEQVNRLKLPADTPLPASTGEHTIRLFARVEWTHLVQDLETVHRLAPFHLWKDSIVEDRFHYDQSPGIHVAFLRAYTLSAPWSFPDSPKYGGCRSWVKLPDPPKGLEMRPVLTDEAHEELGARLRAFF